MMGKENHLRFPCQITQGCQSSSRAAVVKVDEQIVRNERQRAVTVDLHLQSRQPQRQKLLVASALTLTVDPNALARWAHRDQARR